MNTPLVSIIIPVYNTENYLPRCLDSIQAQTYTNFEAILVDDGSKDQSGIICDEYARMDSRIEVIHKENEGVSKARIDGFNKSKADYIIFVDADDYLSDKFVEKMLSEMINNDVDFISCQYYDLLEDNIQPNERSITGKYSGVELEKIVSTNLYYDKKNKMAGMPLYVWGKLFKRNILSDHLSAGDGYWYGEDQIIIISIIYHAHSILILPDYLYYYVHHDGQVTSFIRPDNWDAYYKMWKKLIEIDVKNLLFLQLSHRIWTYTISFYDNAISHFISYKEYKRLTKHIFESDLVRDRIFNSCIKDIPRSFFERRMFFLLKYKLYSILYIQVKRMQKARHL